MVPPVLETFFFGIMKVASFIPRKSMSQLAKKKMGGITEKVRQEKLWIWGGRMEALKTSKQRDRS